MTDWPSTPTDEHDPDEFMSELDCVDLRQQLRGITVADFLEWREFIRDTGGES